jgi:hypothetical protein
VSREAMKQALDVLINRVDADHAVIKTLRQAIQESSENGLYREGYRNGYGFGEAAGLRQAIEQAEKPRQPLTDEEIKDALVSVDPETKRLPPSFRDFARAIEAKLKEKNT